MQGFTKGIPIDTDGSLSLNSDALVPSQAAVRKYVAGFTGGTGGASIGSRIPMSSGPQTISSTTPVDVNGATTSFVPTATGNHLIAMSFDVLGVVSTASGEEFVGILAINGIEQPAGAGVHAVFHGTSGGSDRACVSNTVVVSLVKGVTYTIKLQAYVNNTPGGTNSYSLFPTHTGFSIVGAVGSGGGGGGGGTSPVLARNDFNGDGGTVLFLLTSTPVASGVLYVALNGNVLPISAWTLSGAQITMGVAPITGDILSVGYFTTLPTGVSHIQEDFTGAGGTDFTLAHAPAVDGVLLVARNGNIQLTTAWSIVSSTILRFASAVDTGDAVSCSYNY